MPDNPEKSTSPHPDRDRRLHARQRIHSLSYVKMGDANGGIVLNISEGGISVQAAAVLDASEPVTMWLEIPKVRNRLEVTGEIVWLGASRKEAGLRFVDLPGSTLQHIRKWMAREASPEEFEDEADPVSEEQDVPDVPVAVMQSDETDVRELSEANIMSAEEIKSLQSAPEPIRQAAAVETEEKREEEAETEDEIEIEAAEVAEADQDDAETEEDVDQESETEVEAQTEREAEVELRNERRVEEKAEEDAQVEIADEAPTEHEAESEVAEEEESQTEDELIQAFGPPVVPFERRPHAPFSSMNAMAGSSRSAQNLAIAPPLSREIPKIFAEPVAPPEAAADSGWKVFRIQLQTGWFLAALVLLLALISFIAGMAVRRGALNDVLGEQQDSLIPKSSLGSGGIFHAPAVSGGGADATTAKPLSIEIVDTANHRWVIPASTGTNHASATVAPDAVGTSPASAVADRAKTNDANSQGPAVGQLAAGAPGSQPASANAGKTEVPLVLSLPETPISASGSVAISSQRSVPVPADGSRAAQNGRNLQVGQLINLVEPVYPADAVQQKIEGTVKLHAVIGTDGVIESLAQVSGPQALVNASMAAVRNWKYSPTRMNGQAIETQEDISFVFRLPN
jgi:TonB family protein